MKSPLACAAAVLVCSLAAAPAVRAQQTAAADAATRAQQDIASLIPADAVAVVRLASIDELLQHAIAVTKAAGRDTANVTADRLLSRAGLFPGKRELIDRQLPIVLAVVLPRATPPAQVLILPTTDPAAYGASLAPVVTEPVIAGSYVAVPLSGKYERPAAPSALLAELPPGTIAAYTDAEKLLAVFGKVVGGALSAAKGSMAREMAQSSTGIDTEALADLYIEGIRSVLGCAKTVRAGVGYDAGRLDVFLRLAVKPDSDMSGWGAAPLPAGALVGPPADGGTFEALMAADWQKLWPRFDQLMERFSEIYPKETGAAVRAATAAYAKVYDQLGPVIALSGDLLATGGIRVLTGLAPKDAASLHTELDKVLATSSFAQIGVTFAPPRKSETGGATITDHDLTIDFEQLAKALALEVQAGRIEPAALLRAALGGGSLPLRLATKTDRGVVAIGAWPDAALLRALGGERRAWSKAMQRAVARVADCNPLVVERVDLAAFFTGLVRVFRELDATTSLPELPAGATADVLFSGGIRGDEWCAGIGMDVEGLAKLFSALQPR